MKNRNCRKDQGTGEGIATLEEVEIARFVDSTRKKLKVRNGAALA